MTQNTTTELTQEYLKSILHYDYESGLLTWKIKLGNYTKVGNIAGTLMRLNYRRIGINKKQYLAHRLIWLYVNGTWPKNDIDHIDGNPENNRIENLRDVPTRKNCQNRKEHRRGKLVGAYFDKRRNNWQAAYTFQGKRIRLGRFDTQKEANKAYKDAILKLPT